MVASSHPRAFLSYSWDSQAHTDWVLQLATRLQGDGVEIVLDRWDTHTGSDLSLFMERAADEDYRVLAIVSETYVEKANEAEGGVGYEKRVITPGLMKDLRSHRVMPLLRGNPSRALPVFMGAAKYIDFHDDELYEDGYYLLLQELHGVRPTPRPPLGKNPFDQHAVEAVPVALRQDPARYVMPALDGTVSFKYDNNNGRYVVGAGDRSFNVNFSSAGDGSIYVYNDPKDIDTVALAPGVTSPDMVGDASSYDGSSRVRTVKVGDAAILRNKSNYWAAIFIDEVVTRETSPTQEPQVVFRYFIPPVPGPEFGLPE